MLWRSQDIRMGVLCNQATENSRKVEEDQAILYVLGAYVLTRII